jgi:CheY-like chemotaxis protein
MILDMMTPGRDGLEVLEELRREIPDLKVIAISGGLKGDTSWLEPLTLRLGVQTFMHKPFGKDDLLQTIDSVLGADVSSEQND